MPGMEKAQEGPEAPPIETLGEAAKGPAKDQDAPAKLSADEKDGASPEDYSSKAVNKTSFTAYLVIIPTPALRAHCVDDL
jgi:hypothetical protein